MKRRSIDRIGLTLEQTEALAKQLGRPELVDEHPNRVKGKRSKYGAQPTVYNGIKYHSKGEANHARNLDVDKAAGIIKWWIRQIPFTLGVPEYKIVVDFLIVSPLPGGGERIHVDEFKGAEPPKWKKDRVMWESYGPCLLRVIYANKTPELIIPKGLR